MAPPVGSGTGGAGCCSSFKSASAGRSLKRSGIPRAVRRLPPSSPYLEPPAPAIPSPRGGALALGVPRSPGTGGLAPGLRALGVELAGSGVYLFAVLGAALGLAREPHQPEHLLDRITQPQPRVPLDPPGSTVQARAAAGRTQWSGAAGVLAGDDHVAL